MSDQETHHDTSSEKPHRCRVHMLFVPNTKCGYVGGVILFVGAVLLFTLGVLLALPVVDMLGLRGPVAQAVALAVAMPVFMACAVVGWFSVFDRIYHARAVRTFTYRTRHLDRIAADKSARLRLPHRLIEHWKYQRRAGKSRLKRLMEEIGTGSVVVLRKYSYIRYPTPKPDCIPFEPVQALLDQERIDYLILTHLHLSPEDQAQESSPPKSSVARSQDPKPPFRERYAWVIQWFWILVVVGLLTGSICGMLVAPSLSIALVLLLPIAGGLCGLLIMSVFRNRQWWIVPGGLIYREHRVWWRKDRVGRITPADSSLVIDHHSNHCYALADGRLMAFACSDWDWWLLAAAWVSTLPPPTMEQVQSFFDSASSDTAESRKG